MMKLNAPIFIKETAGISRSQEPVTVGIPIPQGMLKDNSQLTLIDSDQIVIPLQTTPLAHWCDGSVKWLLLDFKVQIDGGQDKELLLQTRTDNTSSLKSILSIEERGGKILVDTGSACFHLSTDIFKPFLQVVIDGQNFLAEKSTATVLTDTEGRESLPVISSWEWETSGPLRSTLKIIGKFLNDEDGEQLSFISRLSFFAGLSLCKIDFTLWNPRAAKHPGGLWDLGDLGSFYFDDFSITLFPQFCKSPDIGFKETVDGGYESITNRNLLLYQDSSGGNNWQSRNHVNRDNEVKTSFRGYKVFSAGEEIKKGLRADPCIVGDDGQKRISVALRHFWQNFPKALGIDQEKIMVSLFPEQYNDAFELQGGERKTHTCWLNFNKSNQGHDLSGWVHNPLEARATPEWYAASQAIPYLVPENQVVDKRLNTLVRPAVAGGDSFFDRREIIDEYGWRNFGDWYADHEAVGHKGLSPLIAHYNNQYDGIYGTLCQYLMTGNINWFALGDQLCRHVRDIDIYSTNLDKPEYNKGLLWHTEHYLDAQTATHRCFSNKHANSRDLTCYGGGPATSHNYASGLLFHYYLTGEECSREALLDLVEFVGNVTKSKMSLTNFAVESLRKTRTSVKNLIKGKAVVDFDKVYSMDGPGRGSGNTLATLMTAYELTKDLKFLNEAEDIIRICINPSDNIDKMDMLDVENRWMYTIFLQAVGKYLDLMSEDQNASLWNYARKSLLHYAGWMVEKEYLYLDTPEILEYPNETWAAQEIRKCNVLLIAAKYSHKVEEQKYFRERAKFFYDGCLKQLQTFKTSELTRPITILLQNSLVPLFFLATKENTFGSFVLSGRERKKYGGTVLIHNRTLKQFYHVIRMLSIKTEVNFIRQRLKR